MCTQQEIIDPSKTIGKIFLPFIGQHKQTSVKYSIFPWWILKKKKKNSRDSDQKENTVPNCVCIENSVRVVYV